MDEEIISHCNQSYRGRTDTRRQVCKGPGFIPDPGPALVPLHSQNTTLSAPALTTLIQYCDNFAVLIEYARVCPVHTSGDTLGLKNFSVLYITGPKIARPEGL